MGRDVTAKEYTRTDHTRYRNAVRRCLDTLEQMLDAKSFVEEEWRTGVEIELNLVDEDMGPSMNNDVVLEHIDDPNYTTELGKFTIELNVEPRRIDGQSLLTLESAVRRNLNRARDRAGDHGADIATIGILPTLEPPATGADWMTPNARYRQLDAAVLRARREDIELDITGAEQLRMTSDSIAVEAACTSVQLHLQVSPERFADYWNAAQVLAGPQLTLGANSPFLFGRQLWAETRTELFLQGTDARSAELRNQGVRPLVPFGDRW
ncbi:glutamate-cysteine ligase family protein, partial [Georgenia sp. 10Sc9-8]|nr:glutamate-cysteine ligase family protein [Georgenia halotolerans]